MHAFYFGTSPRQLFGVYHPADVAGRQAAVVMCQPVGHEYIRVHRALRTLGARLAARGLHVLRFDYFGCGDSAGEGAEVRVAQWMADVGMAIDELKDTAGVTRVSIVGVRFGATLAAMTSASRNDVDALVLCDPVLQGKAYVAELLDLQRRWLAGRPFVKTPASHSQESEMIGFPLTPDLRADFEAVDLLTLPRWSARRTITLTSNDMGAERLQAHLATLGAHSAAQHIPVDCEWRAARAVHLALLGSELVHAVEEQFINGART